MQRIHLIVTGRVQGVYFRHNTNKIANKLNLKGFVRNLPDGTVEVIAEGEENKLKELTKFCRTGPPNANVEDIKIIEEEPKNEFKEFSIKF